MLRSSFAPIYLCGLFALAGCSARPAPSAVAPRTPTTNVTPTPTPTSHPPGTPLPTARPGPTPWPTETLAPTVIPAFPAAAGQPDGWFVYSAVYHVIPDSVAPSAYGCHLHAVSFDGSGDVDLTPDGTQCAGQPAISPDGRWIAYLVGREAGMAIGLAVVSVDGAQRRVFDPHPLSDGELRWSKDMARIAYFHLGDRQWHVLDAQDGRPLAVIKDLAAAGWYLPNLSPDGRYRARYCRPDPHPLEVRLCLTDAAADVLDLGSWRDDAIAWSPDGAWIAAAPPPDYFQSSPSPSGVYLQRPDGSSHTRLSDLQALAIWIGGRP